tara:strand:- start:5158 stop:5913 length:756 start_codon:yes stop_codon:yes gene_type:complete
MSIPLIDDNNYHNFIKPPKGFSKGCEGRGMGNLDHLRGFGALGIPLLPKESWDDTIRDNQKNQSDLQTFLNDMAIPCKDQNGTNYCWINSPTHCAEIDRAKSTGTYKSMSPASGGARIKKYRNQGGWGLEAVEWFVDNGVNYSEDWPDNEIDRRLETDENTELALKNRVIEFVRLDTWEEQVSCMLANIPTADGYSWWGHLVTGVGLTIGNHNRIIRNSWAMSWGDKGFGELSGRKKYSDGSVAILSMEPI